MTTAWVRAPTWPSSESPKWSCQRRATKEAHAGEPDCGPSRAALAGRADKFLALNFGQLRRNTDRKPDTCAQLAFVIAILLIVRLLDGGHLHKRS